MLSNAIIVLKPARVCVSVRGMGWGVSSEGNVNLKSEKVGDV